MALVEAPGRAAPEDVEADGRAGGVRPAQQGSEDRGAEASALDGRGEIEVLQPVAVPRRAQGDTAREGAGHEDDRRVLGAEAVPQALPDPVCVVAAQSFQIRAHHHRP
jgi:hypothetical protein